MVILTKIPLSSYDVRTNYYENTLFAFGTMLIGIYFSCCFARYICKIKIIAEFLALVGQYSIYILVGQSVLYKVIIIYLENKINLWLVKIIQLCVAVIVPLGIAILFTYCSEIIKNKMIRVKMYEED